MRKTNTTNKQQKKERQIDKTKSQTKNKNIKQNSFLRAQPEEETAVEHPEADPDPGQELEDIKAQAYPPAATTDPTEHQATKPHHTDHQTEDTHMSIRQDQEATEKQHLDTR